MCRQQPQPDSSFPVILAAPSEFSGLDAMTAGVGVSSVPTIAGAGANIACLGTDGFGSKADIRHVAQ